MPTDEAGAYFSQFYEPVRERPDDDVDAGVRQRASSATRSTASSPIAQYATVPRAFVFIQRINLGLYALLGDLRATGNYRRMAEELWPFVDGPPSTPHGRGRGGVAGRPTRRRDGARHAAHR